MHQHPRRLSSHRIESAKARSEEISDAPATLEEGDSVRAESQPSRESAQEAVSGLNQIIQNYFTKACLIILASRIALPPAYSKETGAKRVNKWFNVEVEETEQIRHDVRPWRTGTFATNTLPDMIIEIYIDANDLTSHQRLVFCDVDEIKRDVEAAKVRPNTFSSAQARSRPIIIVERWTLHFATSSDPLPENLSEILPRIYKNSINLFRSLQASTRLLPGWKVGKRASRGRGNGAHPKLKFRIRTRPQHDLHEAQIDDATIPLDTPLYDGQRDIIDHLSLDRISTPAGSFSIQLTHRACCDFCIMDAEALLSSRFAGLDESSGLKHDRRTNKGGSLPLTTINQIPDNESARPAYSHHAQPSTVDQGQTYGSLTTFHHLNPPAATSPISALRAARFSTSESPESGYINTGTVDAPRSRQDSRSSFRSFDYGTPSSGRRPSLSFSPFKAPSLSASPSPAEQLPVSRGLSWSKTSPLAVLAEARNPIGVSANSGPSLRSSPHIAERSLRSNKDEHDKEKRPSAPSRYSSSFGYRKNRLSSGAGGVGISTSRGPDDVIDNSSSSRGSGSRGSLIHPEPSPRYQGSMPGTRMSPSSITPGASTAEGRTGKSAVNDDDNHISSFIRLLEQGRHLKSFNTTSLKTEKEDQKYLKGNDDLNERHWRMVDALGRFQTMRESNAALSESMSASLLIRSPTPMSLPSTSTDSRPPTSRSPTITHDSRPPTSRSPTNTHGILPSSPSGRHVSHGSTHITSINNNHTPAIRSRLSASSIVEYDTPSVTRRRSSQRAPEHHERCSRMGKAHEFDNDADNSDHEQYSESIKRSSNANSDETTNTHLVSEAIDIPLRPRRQLYGYKRSSSVAQVYRLPKSHADEDVQIPPLFMRSASLGIEDRSDESHSHAGQRGQRAALTARSTRVHMQKRNTPSCHHHEPVSQPSSDIDHSHGQHHYQEDEHVKIQRGREEFSSSPQPFRQSYRGRLSSPFGRPDTSPPQHHEDYEHHDNQNSPTPSASAGHAPRSSRPYAYAHSNPYTQAFHRRTSSTSLPGAENLDPPNDSAHRTSLYRYSLSKPALASSYGDDEPLLFAFDPVSSGTQQTFEEANQEKE